jgi:hypothetical protein
MLCVCCGFLCFLCARWDLFQAYVQEAVRDSREMKFRLDHRFFGTAASWLVCFVLCFSFLITSFCGT